MPSMNVDRKQERRVEEYESVLCYILIEKSHTPSKNKVTFLYEGNGKCFKKLWRILKALHDDIRLKFVGKSWCPFWQKSVAVPLSPPLQLFTNYSVHADSSQITFSIFARWDQDLVQQLVPAPKWSAQINNRKMLWWILVSLTNELFRSNVRAYLCS